MDRRVFHVLLVEDNPADVTLFKHACRDSKTICRIHVAPDGEDALEFLRKEGTFSGAPTPDLLVLDLNLPKVGGHEVLECVKADPQLRSIPVIILTSSDCRLEMMRAYSQGASCYITKPTDVERYFEAVLASERFWFRTASLPERRRPKQRAAASGSKA